jgi:hypothetical protein
VPRGGCHRVGGGEGQQQGIQVRQRAQRGTGQQGGAAMAGGGDGGGNGAAQYDLA